MIERVDKWQEKVLKVAIEDLIFLVCISGKGRQFHTYRDAAKYTESEMTGGVISDYVSGSNVYRAHTFTSSGTFDVSDETSDYGSTVEYVVVGGGSGPHNGRGAEAVVPVDIDLLLLVKIQRGASAETVLTVSSSPGSYTVTVGAGGAASDADKGNAGSPSVFGPITSTEVVTETAMTNPGPGGSGGGGGEFTSLFPVLLVELEPQTKDTLVVMV